MSASCGLPMPCRVPRQALVLCVAMWAFVVAPAALTAAARPAEVRHPNLRLNREEIEQVKAKIQCITRQDFSPEAKFFAVTGSVYRNVTQTRALVVTPQYVADLFHAADTNGRPRTFDWVLHGLGRLFPGNPAAYRPTHELLPSRRSSRSKSGWLPGAMPWAAIL